MLYDFFIAYARPDEDQAKTLAWKLQDRGREVFFDQGRLASGAPWDIALRDALEESKVIVVLVSTNSRQAHYQREEIAKAVALARASRFDLAVVPVLIEGTTPDKLPYGLFTMQGFDASEAGGLERVAMELDREFPAIADRPPRRDYDQVRDSIRLDRTSQWSQLLEASQEVENSLFLFHGQVNQNVELFVQRIEHFFSRKVRAPRLVRRVRFNLDGARPETGTDWIGHIRNALACKGALAPELRRIAASQGLFLVLCDSPLPADTLSQPHAVALRELLTDELPRLLKEMGSKGDLSLILVFDYEGDEPPLIKQVLDWGRTAEATGQIRFRPLSRASLPIWDEVRDFVNRTTPPLSEDGLAAMKSDFEDLVRSPGLTFDKLARFIERRTMMGS